MERAGLCQESSNKLNLSYLPSRQPLSGRPVYEVVIKSTIVTILGLVAVIGNVLIIVIVIACEKMRTTTNCYIANLAIADLLVVCFPMWIHVATHVTDSWIMGALRCKLNAFIQGKSTF